VFTAFDRVWRLVGLALALATTGLSNYFEGQA
jgi:hypothetical protein